MKKILNIYWNDCFDNIIDKHYIIKAHKISLDKVQLSIDIYFKQLTSKGLRKPKNLICEGLIKFIAEETNYFIEKTNNDIDNVDMSVKL